MIRETHVFAPLNCLKSWNFAVRPRSKPKRSANSIRNSWCWCNFWPQAILGSQETRRTQDFTGTWRRMTQPDLVLKDATITVRNAAVLIFAQKSCLCLLYPWILAYIETHLLTCIRYVCAYCTCLLFHPLLHCPKQNKDMDVSAKKWIIPHKHQLWMFLLSLRKTYSTMDILCWYTAKKNVVVFISSPSCWVSSLGGRHFCPPSRDFWDPTKNTLSR